jgi:hypothetical protein
MSATQPTPDHFGIELPEITRRDRTRFVKEARRLRAEETAKLFSSLGRGLARLGRALATPLAAALRPDRGGAGRA